QPKRVSAGYVTTADGGQNPALTRFGWATFARSALKPPFGASPRPHKARSRRASAGISRAPHTSYPRAGEGARAPRAVIAVERLRLPLGQAVGCAITADLTSIDRDRTSYGIQTAFAG